MAASSGLSGDRPLAIKSAFTKWITPASSGRYRRAKVVFPAPFGPAMTTHRGFRLRVAIYQTIRLIIAHPCGHKRLSVKENSSYVPGADWGCYLKEQYEMACCNDDGSLEPSSLFCDLFLWVLTVMVRSYLSSSRIPTFSMNEACAMAMRIGQALSKIHCISSLPLERPFRYLPAPYESPPDRSPLHFGRC